VDVDFRHTVEPHRARVLNIMDISRADWLTGLLGREPVIPELFDRALTHGSTGKPDYQRLEFLGDRVLGLVIAEALYARFPDEAEGRLSHRLNSLVAGSTCAEIARAIDLASHMKLGKQARDDGAHGSDNVLGDVMEAIIGALFVDQGLDAARILILTHWSPFIEAALNAPKHPKSALQEYCAANGRKVPEYTVTKKEGPPHAMRFEVTVNVKGFDPVIAEANSKQAAETAAALAFMEANT
jgi:ribonuclease III